MGGFRRRLAAWELLEVVRAVTGLLENVFEIFTPFELLTWRRWRNPRSRVICTQLVVTRVLRR